jgi:signal transduction histidine kinase/CheY-like chemotaxis protein
MCPNPRSRIAPRRLSRWRGDCVNWFIMDQAASVELAAYLSEQRPALMQCWRELVHENKAFPPSAERLKQEELEDHLPDLIEQIAEVLRGHGTTGVDEKASKHGHERRLLGYGLPLILIELRLFRQVLLDATDRWFAAQAKRFDHLDQRAAVYMILEVIDRSLSASAERYTAEAEAERNAALEALVQRTQELERYSQKLEAVSREKDRFLAMLSHELRNPIAPILSAAYLLKQGDIPPSLARARDVIERQARHLTRLVDDLLEVNRMLVGKIHLKKEPCDLIDALKQAAEVCAGGFEAKSITFDMRLKAAKAPVLADPVRLVQIITNLLANAVKFTPVGGHVTLAVEQKEDVWVCQLRDNGVGIEAEMLPRIFEMFAQADSSLDRAHGGLGIGLSLAKYLVEAHGGQIDAESEGLGKGTTFTIRLPLLATDSATRPLPTSPRVAVVEDNPDSRLLLAEVLELKGFTVLTAGDGPSALQIAEQDRPQAFVIDLGLPGMDGYEVAKRIRRIDGDKVLLVALTGYGAPDDLQRAQEAGFNHHMTKPADLERLEHLLHG